MKWKWPSKPVIVLTVLLLLVPFRWENIGKHTNESRIYIHRYDRWSGSYVLTRSPHYLGRYAVESATHVGWIHPEDLSIAWRVAVIIDLVWLYRERKKAKQESAA